MSAAGSPPPRGGGGSPLGSRFGAFLAGHPAPILLVMTVALAGLHVWVTSEITFLARNPADQFGYLANARWLSGDPNDHLLPELAYYGFGYSLFLVPAFWLFDDPELLTRAILVVNALLMATLVPLLYLYCRRILDTARPTAMAAAVVGAVVPATFYDTSLALAENLILPLSAASVLACWLYLTPRPSWQRLLFGPSIALLFATHERFTFVVLWALAIMAVAAVVGLVGTRLAACSIALTVELLIATWLLRSRLISTLWAGGELSTNQADRIPEYRKFFVNPTDFYRLVIEMVGHAWYIAVGTLGIAALGLGFLVSQLGRGRRGQPSPVEDPSPRWPRLSPLLATPPRLTTVFLLGSGLVIFMTSSLYFSLNRFPSDGFIFGRYNEAFVPLWVAAGVAFLFAETRTSRLVTSSWVVMLVTGGLALGLLAGHKPGDLDLYYTPFGVPDVARFRNQRGHLVVTATGVALGAQALLAVACLRERAPRLLLLPLSLWLAVGGVTQVAADEYFESWRLPDQLEELGVERAAVSTDRRAGPPPHYLFYLPDLHVEPWSTVDDDPEAFVFHALGSRELPERGGRIAFIDKPVGSPFGSFALGLWVLPGAQQAKLEREGKLLPAGFPTSLPQEARRAELWLDAGYPTGGLRARAGEDLRLGLRGRHSGTGAPWPDAKSFNEPGRVRVGARPEIDGSSGVVPASAHVELPSWTYPGEEFHVTIRWRAVDEEGQPLRPGRYVYAIDMMQVGYGWFSTRGKEPLHVSLEVTDS